MSLVDEMLQPGPPPEEGVQPCDIIAIVRTLEAASEIPDKRILALRAHRTGAVLVTTGLRIGGSHVVLQRQGDAWAIVEWGGWRS